MGKSRRPDAPKKDAAKDYPRQEQRPQTEAEAAEFPDDTEIDAGANYDVFNPLEIFDPDPDKHYYFAADDGDSIRPDGVIRQLANGYVRSNKKHASPDCILLEEPLERWEKRQAAKAKRDAKAQRDAYAPGGGLQVLPGQRHGAGR
jgi:hypothetical protein